MLYFLPFLLLAHLLYGVYVCKNPSPRAYMMMYIAPYAAFGMMLYGLCSFHWVSGNDFLTCLSISGVHIFLFTPLLLLYSLFTLVYLKSLSWIIKK